MTVINTAHSDIDESKYHFGSSSKKQKKNTAHVRCYKREVAAKRRLCECVRRKSSGHDDGRVERAVDVDVEFTHTTLECHHEGRVPGGEDRQRSMRKGRSLNEGDGKPAISNKQLNWCKNIG